LTSAVTVRKFGLADVAAAARFCDAARALDRDIEPFGQRLGAIAALGRAQLQLWRVACDRAGAVQGIAFAALRESPRGPAHDLYCAVHPALRRQGFGRALCEPALACGLTLRARVRDGAAAGCAFLAALGFEQTSVQLTLRRQGAPVEPPLLPALRIRPARPKDGKILAALGDEAWAGAPDAFLSRADDVAQLFSGRDHVVLLAELERRPAGYLAAAQLGGALAIEELAVLPRFRRMGIGRALLTHALRDGSPALLSVSEDNAGARALYGSLGFETSARRLVMERAFR
jgi:ribosomal protein S18 acetylase RimI-like enzyme